MCVAVPACHLPMPLMVDIVWHTLIINIAPEVVCAVCKTGHHPLCAIRRRLDDDAFELLMGVRDRAKVVAAMRDAMLDEVEAVC